MIFDEQPERSKKLQKTGAWDTPAREPVGTIGTASSSGSGLSPGESAQGTAGTATGTSAELTVPAIEGGV